MKNEVTRATKVARINLQEKKERAAVGVRKVALEELGLMLAPKELDLMEAPKEPDLMEALVEPCIKLDLEAIKLDMKVDIK